MNKFKNLVAKNSIDKNRNFNKFKNFALDVFRWEGLPNGIQSRHIEKQLFNYGSCFFYKNDALGLVCLPCYDSTSMNIYGDFTKGTVRSENGIVSEVVDYSNGVQIWNNDLKEPTFPHIKEYSERMTEVELAIKLNIQQQKFPYFIACNKKNEQSYKKMYEQISFGAPSIFHSDSLEMDSINVLNTNTPYVVDKLNEYRFELEREILTFLGINNNFEKSERLIVDEVNSNNEFIHRNIEIQYKNRLKACEEINKMFGLNVSVTKVTNIVEEQLQEEYEEEVLEETEEKKNIFDTIKHKIKGVN